MNKNIINLEEYRKSKFRSLGITSNDLTIITKETSAMFFGNSIVICKEQANKSSITLYDNSICIANDKATIKCKDDSVYVTHKDILTTSKNIEVENIGDRYFTILPMFIDREYVICAKHIKNLNWLIDLSIKANDYLTVYEVTSDLSDCVLNIGDTEIFVEKVGSLTLEQVAFVEKGVLTFY